MSHRHINATSGAVEYYTPLEIIESARSVLGRIDLDPFSSEAANLRVKADRFYTIKEDGLKQEWVGRFWMNHPFGKGMNRPCIEKVELEHRMGRAVEGMCITYAATSEKWFRPLLNRPQCYLTPRTNYFLPDGTLKTGVTKGSVVTYFGRNVSKFAHEFSSHGIVKVNFQPNNET